MPEAITGPSATARTRTSISIVRFFPPNTPLMVTVLAPTDTDGAAAAWPGIAREALARAFADEEPDYTTADLRR